MPDPDAHLAALGAIWRSRALVDDFQALVECGGRFAGTPSEARARALLRERLGEAAGSPAREHVFAYDGWWREATRLTLLTGTRVRPLAAHALVWSPPTPPGGLEAEVLDLGRGTREEFEAAARAIPGRLVLVRHEYPFAAGVVHRRVKYGWAREHGAVGFLIASNLPGDVLVTGSSGRGGPEDIPAAGVTWEGGAALGGPGGLEVDPARGAAAEWGSGPAPGGGAAGPGPVGPGAAPRGRRARLEIAVRRGPAEAANLLVEVPGRTPEWVVLSAHYDGHDLAESALDNATGVAAVLAIVRALAPRVPSCPRGLRAILFTVEEWGLWGSRVYVDGLSEAERRAVALNVNLDTLAGGPSLAALVSGFEDLGSWVTRVAAEAGLALRPVLPFMPNSDHANFARRGIPALRLVAGFDDPTAGGRYLLTTGDTRDKVPLAELKAATLAAAELTWRALTWPGPIASHRPEPYPAG